MDFTKLLKILYPNASFKIKLTEKGYEIYEWKADIDKPDLKQFEDKAVLAKQITEAEHQIKQLKQQMNDLDWYFIREYRTQGAKPVPQEIADQMQSCNDQIDTLEAQIDQLTSEIMS